jgi:YebC/PmpR family DNA-binding regulatory protein
MSGHSKWSKIKHKKAATDAKKSKEFSKIARLIASESKKVGGDANSPTLRTIIEKARAANMPKDNIERAIEKGRAGDGAEMDALTFELYGPGGCAIIVEALTDNRNRTNQELKHLLSKQGYSLAAPGSASWAFTKNGTEWTPTTTTDLSDEDVETLAALIDEIEDHDDVQMVFTNVS